MPHTLDSDQLRTLVAIADSGSFTRAGNEVNKTQSAVSMQVKRLEEMVGKKLFARDGRNSRLTADGEILLDYARRIVRLNDEALSMFRKPDEFGLVRFGTPNDYADNFLPQTLAGFARTNRGIQVEVKCDDSEVLIAKTEAGELDLAVVSCTPNTPFGEIIRHEKLIWVTSARHCAHEEKVVPLALSNYGCAWRQMAMGALESQGKDYRLAYASSNNSAIAAAVMAGLAVAAIPEMVLRPGMRVLTPAEGFPDLGYFDIGLISPPGKQTPAVKALAAHITDNIGDYSRPMIAAE
ncbi:MAG: LysR family transcriptional regulator [Rhizobiales bacterium]|nr:LysR family transcriptional regulator [Hyphomicrobiales bacterium]